MAVAKHPMESVDKSISSSRHGGEGCPGATDGKSEGSTNKDGTNLLMRFHIKSKVQPTY